MDVNVASEKPAPEPNLLVRHREGHRDAFGLLVSRYRAPVYSYLIRCGVDHADRDDLFQEIFLRIHRSAGQYDAERPLHPWIFTVVANAVRSYHRNRKVQTQVFAEPTENEQEAADSGPDSERRAASRERVECVERELARLAPIQREVLLASVNGLLQKDIAEAFGLPLNTVKTHLRRARLKLMEKLSEVAS